MVNRVMIGRLSIGFMVIHMMVGHSKLSIFVFRMGKGVQFILTSQNSMENLNLEKIKTSIN